MSLFPAPVLWRLAAAVLLPSRYPRFNLGLLTLLLDDFRVPSTARRAVTSEPPLFSSLRRRPCAALCACVRLCACAVRAPEDSGDGAFRGSTEFQSAAGCSSALPCADRLRRGPRIRSPDAGR